MVIESILDELKLPNVLTTARGAKIKTKKQFESNREKIKKILEQGEYGKMPDAPDKIEVNRISVDEVFCAGKGNLEKYELTSIKGDKKFTFPISVVVPNRVKGKIPAFVLINFRPDVPDKYLPSEELVDAGFAVFSFCYKDVSGDNNNFKDAGAKFLCPNRRRKDAPGKIAMWAWAASRVLDYIETRPEIDAENVAVVGHSRLGKTALVAGAFDERFKFAISNDSGCSGAAITRGKIGEDKKAITHTFPFWFCPRFNEPTKIEDLEFDQHYLLSLIVPRHIVISSAVEDTWSDPKSEFLCAYKANEIYKLYGLDGIVTNEDKIPEPKTVLDGGEACYHIRHGKHYFSREDWLVYIDYVNKKINEENNK